MQDSKMQVKDKSWHHILRKKLMLLELTLLPNVTDKNENN